MATQFARTFQPAALVPFLVAGSSAGSARGSFAAALKAAAAAVKARGDIRNPRQQITLLFCELGKAYGCNSEFPLSRAALASALGLSLVRVKRTLALLSLSGVISSDGDSISVLDWRKLSGAASFDPAALNLDEDEEDEEIVLWHEDKSHLLTASGEPACFV